jgi:hypothetical protein
LWLIIRLPCESDSRAQESMGSPKFFDAPLHACHVLMTPAGLWNLTNTIPSCGLLVNVNDCRLHLQALFGAVPDFREVRSPLRPTWFPVYASSLSFGSSISTLLLRTCNTRYGWLVRSYPAGTCTLQEAPSLSWRTRGCASPADGDAGRSSASAGLGATALIAVRRYARW